MPDHVHMLISIPPIYSAAQIIGYMKEKSSIWIAAECRTQDAEFYGPQIETIGPQRAWQTHWCVRACHRSLERLHKLLRGERLCLKGDASRGERSLANGGVIIPAHVNNRPPKPHRP
jgi:hypothetical protein